MGNCTPGIVPSEQTNQSWLVETGICVHSSWTKLGIGTLLVHIAQHATSALKCSGIAIQEHALVQTSISHAWNEPKEDNFQFLLVSKQIKGFGIPLVLAKQPRPPVPFH